MTMPNDLQRAARDISRRSFLVLAGGLTRGLLPRRHWPRGRWPRPGAWSGPRRAGATAAATCPGTSCPTPATS